MIKETGWLWRDADETADLPTKVQKACEAYRAKFGKPVARVYVRPDAIGFAQSATVGGTLVMPNQHTQSDHFFVVGKESDD